ncbi:MAG: hypothetical protein GTO40_08075 [Deltaproteobacteria bacterium]|nr:hypothetical protein [Deltaproteobacteria bacterium]
MSFAIKKEKRGKVNKTLGFEYKTESMALACAEIRFVSVGNRQEPLVGKTFGRTNNGIIFAFLTFPDTHPLDPWISKSPVVATSSP